MKPGRQEKSVLFDKRGEVGIALAASDIYLTDEESKLISRRLRAAKEPYELQAPYSEITTGALRKLAEARLDSRLTQAAKSMLNEFDTAASAI